MERSVAKFLDSIDNLDFSKEYKVIYTMKFFKTRLIARKQLQRDMERINFEDNNEIYDTFKEENITVLIESISTGLKIIQD